MPAIISMDTEYKGKPKKKFLYIHVPRTGGRSMSYGALWMHQDKVRVAKVVRERLPPQKYPYSRNANSGHISAAQLKTVFRDEYEEFFSFSVIRNIYDKTASQVHYLMGAANLPFCKWPEFKDVKWKELTFDQLMNIMEHVFVKDPHEKTLWGHKVYVCDGNEIAVTKLYHYESGLDSILQDAANEIGIPVERWCGNPHRGHQSNYSEWYTPRTRKLVENWFGDEIDYFGFRFGEE